MVGSGNGMRFGDLLGTPFAGAPVHHFALLNQVMHRTYGFFNRRIDVRTVTKKQVKIIHFQPFQRGITGIADMFRTQTQLHLLVATPKHF